MHELFSSMLPRVPAPRDNRLPLPPLTALRAFEAAARHLSFTRAARELFVTQTAISHQIKLLEAHLGARLFRRLPRRLALTRTGSAWAGELGDIFARLHDANRRLRSHARPTRPVVAVSAIPSFAARWLVPRLGRFMQAHPELDVYISPSEHLVDFTVEALDLGIRYGAGNYPELVVTPLSGDALVAVCAPSLQPRRKLRRPAELRRHVLLHDDAPEGWAQWLARQRVHGVDAARGTVLVDSSMLVEAAVQGQGIALARLSLALGELSAGRLVLPFPTIAPLPTALAYYIAAPRENLTRPAVTAFCEWLRREATDLTQVLSPAGWAHYTSHLPR